MPWRKRTRTEAEVTTLATRLGSDWVPGEAVMLWLRKHVDELTELIREQGWSWQDVGRALDVAGIRYATERPWSAEILMRKAKTARDENAKRAAKRARRTMAEQHTAPAEPTQQGKEARLNALPLAAPKTGTLRQPATSEAPAAVSEPAPDDANEIVLTPFTMRSRKPGEG